MADTKVQMTTRLAAAEEARVNDLRSFTCASNQSRWWKNEAQKAREEAQRAYALLAEANEACDKVNRSLSLVEETMGEEADGVAADRAAGVGKHTRDSLYHRAMTDARAASVSSAAGQTSVSGSLGGRAWHVRPTATQPSVSQPPRLAHPQANLLACNLENYVRRVDQLVSEARQSQQALRHMKDDFFLEMYIHA